MAKVVKCLECGKKFIQKTYRHIFHCRRCFRIFYRKKKIVTEITYFACPSCGKRVALDFDPRKKSEKWNTFGCPSCTYTNAERMMEEVCSAKMQKSS